MAKNYWNGHNPAPRMDPYQRQDTRIEYQVFSNEYFSGADMHIYFGDIWVDEITSLSFVLEEEILPIYGYNSYTFDTIARGKRIVQGSFSMNFKGTGYLKQILDNAEAIEFALEQGTNKKTIDPQYYDKYKLDEILKMYGKDSFDQLAEEYEAAIWGEAEDKDFNYISPPHAPYFQRYNPYGFEIRINYGAVSETQSNKASKVYGNSEGKFITPNLTVETLNGVQLRSMSKQAATSDQGSPLQETYGFIARDLNGSSLL